MAFSKMPRNDVLSRIDDVLELMCEIAARVGNRIFIIHYDSSILRVSKRRIDGKRDRSSRISSPSR